MRIAVVFGRMEARTGGASTFSNTILEGIQAAAENSDHEFVFYARGELEDVREFRRIPAGRAHRFAKGARRLLRAAQDYVGAPRWGTRSWFERSIEKERVEMVWFATPYAEECDVPFVFTLWDLAHLELPWFPEVSHGGEWERRDRYFSRFLKKATAVTVPNRAGAEQLERHFSISEQRILTLGFPTPTFALDAADRPASRAVLDRYGIEQPYLFYPALFWAHKNHLLLLETIAELRRRGLSYRAVCVGADAGQLDHIRDLAKRLGVQDDVFILGFVDTDELVDLYKNAHALTHLTFVGPGSLPPLEAFALGCPVIATSVHGAREHLGDAALLVSAMNPEQAADAVVRLNEEPLRAELIKKGSRRAREMTPGDYVQQVLDFLDRFERVRRSWP